MSTEYTVFKRDGLEVELGEHSNKFDLTLYNGGTQVGELVNLTTVELVGMALQILKVASYWGDTQEMTREALEQMVRSDATWIAMEVIPEVNAATD